MTSANERVLKSLTCTALQRNALAVFELVSWAAAEAVIFFCADDAVSNTGFTPLPSRGEEPLWTDFPTLTLKQVPGLVKFI